MKPIVLLVLLVLLVAGLTAISCNDPAADPPKATVVDVKSTPAATAGTTGDALKIDVPAGAFTFDSSNSSIGFVGSKVTGSHEGGFRNFTGFIHAPDGKIEGGKVKVVIDMWSVWADEDKLTGHLKKNDFFLVPAHPIATFESTAVLPAPGPDGTYDVTGQLSLRGVTASITFPAQITLSEKGATCTAKFSLKRRQFGVNYDGAADNLVRDDVVVKLMVKAQKK